MTKKIIDVELSPEMGGMPCIRDDDGDFAPLFHVFAVMEENCDFVAMCNELPWLSAGTVENVIRHICEMLQKNSAGIEIEPLIEEYGYGPALDRRIAAEIKKKG